MIEIHKIAKIRIFLVTVQTKKKRQDSDQQCQRFKGNTDPDTQIVVKLHIVGQTEGRRIDHPAVVV